LFRIGDFSRLARVSCRLLRYYDELGLLRPASVERDTGYRYYSAAQLPRLNRILVLKELGFSLEEIGRILEKDVSAAELRGMLLVRRSDVARAVAQASDRLRQIEARIAQIDTEGRLSADDVILRSEPARSIVATRQVLPSFAAARGLIGELLQWGGTRSGLGELIAIAHSPEFEADSLDVEFGFVLQRLVKGEARLPGGRVLAVREMPAVERIAACVRVGLPEHAHLVTARIASFVEANGLRLAGPSREVFLQPPRLERMEDSVIEMQFPVMEARGASG
jgi:DNA-binding transcriptional MerR regulator